MAVPQRGVIHGVESSTLGDILERVLDKGIVIAGDIKIKLVDVELLTAQIRLVICSVDKAIEMGMDWWVTDPNLSSGARKVEVENRAIRKRLEEIEARLASKEAKP
ncbi:MAG: gas vesicle protein [Candidatus Handelsmanbacteria bacterium RIFCSPLOWO2_12_FULL_64_10]|uniref:Gas vesicle protein n=1 Tax=Handelsmanbacteria sp. (strain RIFCSPLOWO2_12_FULL_64_10) TaxID=1817868 RepID=A0A1F6CBC2_HANXR|nr:MAG: gas vesicle protein [Candidatus Handelsmanbacteria bacterium RIFCSPLOWO2_12_FULL_64_10]